MGLAVLAAIMAFWAMQPADHAKDYGIREIPVLEARQWIDAGAVVLDVREAAVARASHVPGAIMVPLEMLSSNLSRIDADRAQRIVVYCGDGTTRGPAATALLNQAGYANAVNMKGGIESWRAAGLATKAL